ncbi:solanimycin export family MATE transporter SolL [Dickeya zeae]|uniref:solanimycin export family MATE transporter SolL n=1 Tax=Dickeya zeae TaxID=204042 RepID=UPI00299DEC54|nr:solanimycin export family MATE transporter SolL [Dickeya zeae]
MSPEIANEKPNALLQGSILRSLAKIGVPVIFANLLQSGYIMIDAFWVGRLGDKAVAAISVSQPIIFLAFALGIGLSVAGTTLVAQCIGARLYQRANDIAAQVFTLSILFSIPIAVAGYFLAPWMLHALGAQNEVFPYALSFLRVIISGIIFTFGFSMLQSLMRGAGEVRIPLLITLGTLILNAIMDPLLIFGYGIIPAFGVAGAAIATLINQGIAMIAGLLVLRFGRVGLKIYFRAMKPKMDMVKSVARLGMPASIELCAHALGASGMMTLVTGLGTDVTAAYGVVININALVIVPAIGMSIATAALVGQNVGAGQSERARAIGRLSGAISFLILTVIGLIGVVFSPYIIGTFAPDQPMVIAHGAHFFHLIAPSYGLIGLQMALNGAFRATGRTMTTMALALVSQWLIQIPLAWGLSHYTSLGVSGLWWAFPITNLLMAGLTIMFFERIDWQRSTLTHSLGASAEKQPDTV